MPWAPNINQAMYCAKRRDIQCRTFRIQKRTFLVTSTRAYDSGNRRCVLRQAKAMHYPYLLIPFERPLRIDAFAIHPLPFAPIRRLAPSLCDSAVSARARLR
ncbi:hypothetical protein D3C81_984570 [compost metagenome]